MNANEFKEVIQSGHLNFLIGSGLSAPFLKTLGNVESLLTSLDKDTTASEDIKKVARVSILKKYFDLSISKNKEILDCDLSCSEVSSNYSKFITAVNNIITKRRSSILNKQVNLFTTNMDVFLEGCLESSGVEFNDGFVGTLRPSFALSNFKKSILKTSAHYGNTSELALFNIYKIHGSVTWKISGSDESISLDNQLGTICELRALNIDAKSIVDMEKIIDGKAALKTTEEILEECSKIKLSKEHSEFLECYDRLVIINPTKEKFKFTTLNYTYYELLRMFSNELERENAVLFVMGFSFADEHIREIVLRALSANPTLIVCIFAYDEASQNVIKGNLKQNEGSAKYNNLSFVPFHYLSPENEGEEKKLIPYSLDKITDLHFGHLSKSLRND